MMAGTARNEEPLSLPLTKKKGRKGRGNSKFKTSKFKRKRLKR